MEKRQDVFDLDVLHEETTEKIIQFCKDNQIQASSSRSVMLYEILKFAINNYRHVTYSGYFEQNSNGNYGFLRSLKNNFLNSPYDIYISPKLIKENDIRPGDLVKCEIARPKEEEPKSHTACNIIEINNKRANSKRRFFSDLTPTYPTQQIVLEKKNNDQYNLCARMIDLLCPIGKGQRALVVAPPKVGKTTILHSIGTSIVTNYPEIVLIILLICERPEEVTEMKKILPNVMIVSSTFDESNENQAKASEMVIEIAKRLVENGKDVVILLDSITRLTRAYNAIIPSSGKILSGGVEPSAVYKPKKFFGSARNLEEGGSLTIIATTLVQTGSKMDDIIREEFMGTGNSDICLDRNLANKKIFPAIDINSSTRRKEMMLTEKVNNQLNTLHFFLSSMPYEESIRFLAQQVKTTLSNKILLDNMSRMPS